MKVEKHKTITVYSDGGARGNPGPAAYGFVILGPNDTVLAQVSRYIGVTTNNQAEYQGIVVALEALRDLKPTQPVECRLDSQLIVRQINGQYRMKNLALKPWLDKVRAILADLTVPVTFVDIPREQNREADRLVNAALDSFETS